ncbi:MAG TPA: two-component system response regulator [Cyanobacteria bacterium UBA11149]|nr:two-component system response regulator [Cyanobacteria bacterium UBA11367]HBE58081.1 two-component system response regulator [Cyanobacteria bacterium UBA11366]HBK65572.1 two-component system response regulator [Cyanobacteria bacterium UBA11166]HBR74425.1 two-component system response regulator [Cyanobacteria bacterium UBA11159]HBS68733.1 two-component system response regulator [Cyanobacteria bacterium UBA11153]HBW90611.1 two-component system response regulator [Cyanobacteria bacterium UBA11
MASQKILVIDDSRVIRSRVKEMLPANCEILEAKDGIEGLNLIRQARPNLIMLDFLLPKKSGWEVFQEIQSSGELQATPLVLMSGRREEVTEKIPEPFEYFSFVEKPFEKKELMDAIKDAMGKAKKRPLVSPPSKEVLPHSEPSGTSAAEIKALNEKVEKMQAEIDTLKKQVAQMMNFIKQKFK